MQNSLIAFTRKRLERLEKSFQDQRGVPSDSKDYQRVGSAFPSAGNGNSAWNPNGRFHVKNLYNPHYPGCVQPFSIVHELTHNFEVGRSGEVFGSLGPLLLASILVPSKELDFKAYTSNFNSPELESVFSESKDDSYIYDIRATIQTWIDKCNIPSGDRNRIFRRCLIVRFISGFIMEGTRKELGHAITLAMEMYNGNMILRILDYRMHEYIYNVHDQIFQWMTDAVQKYASHFTSLQTETVCLKGKIEVDKQFMTCMSAAFRACIYLSQLDSHWEDKEDFVKDSKNLQVHIKKMLDWVYSNQNINQGRCSLLISPAMSETVCEINPAHCYLLMAPYVSRETKGVLDYHKIVRILDKITPHVRYSPLEGMVVDHFPSHDPAP